MRQLSCTILFSFVILLISGCETPGDGPISRTNPQSADRAQQLYDRNRFGEAARAFEQSAQLQRPDSNYLRAADSYWMARDSQSARRLLSQVRQGELNISERALARLIGIASAGESPPASTVLSQLAFEVDSIPENYRLLFHCLFIHI